MQVSTYIRGFLVLIIIVFNRVESTVLSRPSNYMYYDKEE